MLCLNMFVFKYVDQNRVAVLLSFLPPFPV